MSPAKIWNFFQVVMDFGDGSKVSSVIFNWLQENYNLELKPTIYEIPIMVMVHWNEPVN